MSDSTKRILFLINDLGPGGAERQLIELIKGVSPHHECHLAILDDKKLHYFEKAQPYCKNISIFQRKHKLDLTPVLSIARYCRNNNIDLIQSVLPLASLYAVLTRLFYHAQLICCAIRDAKDGNWKKKLLIKLVCRLSTISISNSKAGLTNRFSKISDNMRVIYNGLDLNRFSKIQPKVKDQGEPIIIAMAASFTHHKDHETLVRAFAKLRPDYDVYLYLFGEGSTQTKIQQLVKQLGNDDRVLFKGFTKNILEELAAVDIAVLTTNTDVHHEGISNSLIEAMALSLPVVATKGGGTDEVLEDQITGFLVNHKDIDSLFSVLKKLIDSPELRHVIGQNGQQAVIERFSYKTFISSYLHLYESF
ncbi:MAG TPA: hypothetical protein DCZ48_13965 [Methylococcaceae bacterium]|nr:hypothetical protein [Methylococcaceae bacterium]